MDERLFTCLAARLEHEAVVLATVHRARGATPRRVGSRMLIAADWCAFSVGGGQAEARVIATARTLLTNAQDETDLAIDLSGRAGAAGVCGGHMQVRLQRWHGAADCARAQALCAALRRGETLDWQPAPDLPPQRLRPQARLLIVGAGHCGLALHEAAQALGFEIWVQDARAECFADGRFAGATVLCGEPTVLAQALDTAREVYAVLLNRDYASDVAALEVLCRRPPCFLGMMGSARRIAAVRAALPQYAAPLQWLRAPIGLDIDAQTPEEIAVSILAQLVQARRARERAEPCPHAD